MSKDEIVQEMFELMMDMACKPKRIQPNVQPKGEKTCLLLLSFHDGEALPGTLAEESGVTTARIAATLKQLESKGLISREAKTEDRRQILVRLTEAGAAEAEAEKKRMRQCWEEIIDVLGLEDSEAALRIMKKLTAHFEERCNNKE